MAPAAAGGGIVALILAAGLSGRMGGRNKLLAVWRGKALVRHVAEQALASRADAVYAVTGYDGGRVMEALAGLPVTEVVNPDYRSGLASSLRTGLQSLPPSIGAVLVCLGDMPQVGEGVLDSLIAAYAPDENRAICIPSYHGRRGNPVLLGERFFPELMQLEGDTGARNLIAGHPGLVAEVPVDTPGILLDVDTPVEMDALPGNHGSADQAY